MGERVCAQEVDANISTPRTRRWIGVRRPNFAIEDPSLVKKMNVVVDSAGSTNLSVPRWQVQICKPDACAVNTIGWAASAWILSRKSGGDDAWGIRRAPFRIWNQ